MFKENVSRTGGLPFKVDHTEAHAIEHLAERFLTLINDQGQERKLVIVCIGPLVGSKLSARLSQDQAVVYGTLEAPVHAVNLKETIDDIEAKYDDPFVIAIDACLGQLSSVGLVTLAHGPLKPGAGVNKVLPEVGNVHITGIVNVGGFMEYFVLQNTRLSVVMRMADCIADSLERAIAQAEFTPLKQEAPKLTLTERMAALRSNLFPPS